MIGGVTVHGKADRIDRLADGGLAIVDYKTGKAPAQKAVDAGFRAAARPARADRERRRVRRCRRASREAHEYWSLTKYGDGFGKRVSPGQEHGRGGVPRARRSAFHRGGAKWLTGDEPFTAKLNPAYAPYGDYDQLMRLEEWYGRE